MKAIIIGAGRGARLMPHTENEPKCFTPVHGKRIIDWTLNAFHLSGIEDICFIGGYHIDCVQEAYPQLRYYENDDWENNNILASLMYAEAEMGDPFICCYSDTLFSPAYIQKIAEHDADTTLALDTNWANRYDGRTEHPTSDAEKTTIESGIVTQVHRDIPEGDAYGEFTGIAKFSEVGAENLRTHYHATREKHAGKPYREASVFEKAYFIHMLQDMIEQGHEFAHIDHHGEYIEIDTNQDLAYAQEHWHVPFQELSCLSKHP